ncbi:hypothetical protein [Flectobacillus roseus]|uniref:hypothetical protein n=1 Tax=Flectobacillus roseus TaxID=502259 RepID=UPI0024B64E05|nr:hypothetical protein [Flectobacillus roseus]MDI9867703.1 hypothetical protein [Flectobacillus roseus]
MKNMMIPMEIELKPSEKVLELNQLLPINDSSGKIVDIFIPNLSKINLNTEGNIELPLERAIEYDRLLLKVYKCSYISALLAKKIGAIYELIKKENSAKDETTFLEKFEYLKEFLKADLIFSTGSKKLQFKYQREQFCSRLEAFFIRRTIFKYGIPCVMEDDNKLLLRIQKGDELTKYCYYSLTEGILKSYFKEYLELNQILVDLETNYSSLRGLLDLE